MSPIHGANDADLNLLLALNALLEERHVTRAAKRLGLSQPAMSHALQRLRDQLGDPLFVRTPKGVAPTDRALRMEEPLRRVLTELQELLADRGFDPTTARRTFTLATPDFGQLVLLPPLLAAVREEAPHVRIVSSAPSADSIEALSTGRLDLLVGGGGPNAPANLRRQVLIETELVLMARKDHPGLRGKLTLEKLAALPHVKLQFRDGLGGPVDAALAEKGLVPNYVLTMSDLVTAIFIAARTDLVVIAGDLLAETFRDTVPLQSVRLPLPSARRPIAQLWHERQHADPGHAWFRKKVFQAAATLRSGRARR